MECSPQLSLFSRSFFLPRGIRALESNLQRGVSFLIEIQLQSMTNGLESPHSSAGSVTTANLLRFVSVRRRTYGMFAVMVCHCVQLIRVAGPFELH